MTAIRSDSLSTGLIRGASSADALARSSRPQHRQPEAFGDFAAFDVSDDTKISLPGQGHVTPDVGHASRQIAMHLLDD